MIIRRIIARIQRYKRESSSSAYIAYLRKKGIRIGQGTIIFDPKNISIDVSRPELIEIGENVFLHKGTQIMSHDWASYLFVNAYNDFIPSHDPVKIGNNVWLGRDVTILKGVTIGENVLIGMGSIVTKDIPANSVAVGTPAKVIMTLDEYYKRRKEQYTDEAIRYAISIFNNGRTPSVEEFFDDYPVFVDSRNYKNYPYNYLRQFRDEKTFYNWLNTHRAPFNGFEEFIAHVVNIMAEEK